MENLVIGANRLIDAMLIASLVWAAGRMTHSLGGMRNKAKTTFQIYLTDFLTGFVVFIGISAIVLFGVSL